MFKIFKKNKKQLSNKSLIVVFSLTIVILSCDKKQEMSSIDSENWSKRKMDISSKDSLEYGKTYLSIYSQIYSLTEHKTHNLTAMASLRNTSDKDTIFLLSANYYATNGAPLRSYFEHPIYIAPLETTEIIIDELDTSGGTGSNFIFEWKIPKECPEPLFEGIMNSTLSQQGLSFKTEGKRID